MLSELETQGEMSRLLNELYGSLGLPSIRTMIELVRARYGAKRTCPRGGGYAGSFHEKQSYFPAEPSVVLTECGFGAFLALSPLWPRGL
jgi:hypothetical protein